MLGPLRKRIGAKVGERLYIVMACENLEEASQVSRHLSQVNTGSLITYRRAEDIMFNRPSGPVALIILATRDEPAATGRILAWIRHRWPRCPVAVVGETGGGPTEISARAGGASYLTRPVSSRQWASLLRHVLGGTRQAEAKKSIEEQTG